MSFIFLILLLIKCTVNGTRCIYRGLCSGLIGSGKFGDPKDYFRVDDIANILNPSCVIQFEIVQRRFSESGIHSKFWKRWGGLKLKSQWNLHRATRGRGVASLLSSEKERNHNQKAPEDAADWKWEKINGRTALLLLKLKRMWKYYCRLAQIW